MFKTIFSCFVLGSLLKAEATATAAATWFTPFMSGLGLRCLAVLEDVWEAEVVAAASAAGFDLVVTTAFRYSSGVFFCVFVLHRLFM